VAGGAWLKVEFRQGLYEGPSRQDVEVREGDCFILHEPALWRISRLATGFTSQPVFSRWINLEFYVCSYPRQMFLEGIKESFPVSLLNREGNVVSF